MKASDLRGILQYVPRFREKTFVIAVDGGIVSSENFTNILLDIAVLRSLSIKVVIVHGASAQIERLAIERGVTASNTDGTGITDEPTLKLALEASAQLTHEILQGLTAVDLRAAVANSIIAHPAGILGGVDYLSTGRVEKVDTRSLQLFLNEGIVPVIPPLGFDGEGKTFRVNSDGIAVEVAEALHAMKIIFLLPQDGLTLHGEIMRQLSITETEDLIRKKKVENKNLCSKLEHGARACRQGVPRVHLLNGFVNEALLTELFSRDGVGTMIYSNEYQQIRRIFKKDVGAVLALIRESVQSEELVRRTRADITARIEDYWVMEIDRALVGCVAVHSYPAEQMAEIACLHVSKSQAGHGYGRKLMTFAEGLAAGKGFTKVFALSTQAFAYFQQKGGYGEVGPDILPAERRERYDTSGRNSKILLKELPPAAVVEAARTIEH
jgi:amino-acid N-acetyltransferase